MKSWRFPRRLPYSVKTEDDDQEPVGSEFLADDR